MDLFNLPPLDMHIVTLRRDQQPTPRMLLGIAVLALSGLFLSWHPGAVGTPGQQVQVASNAR